MGIVASASPAGGVIGYPPNHVEQAHPRARRLPLGCPRQRVLQSRSPGNRKLSHDNASPTAVQDAIAPSSVLEAFLQRSYVSTSPPLRGPFS